MVMQWVQDQWVAGSDLAAEWDVVVIGGGAAGLNGALQLVRARRRVLVIDGGEPRNAPAEGVHGLLAREGTPPGELLARGRSEVTGYGGVVIRGAVSAVRRAGERFSVELTGEEAPLMARQVLVATGVIDLLPQIPGLFELWGRGVVHCPYCHGWEVRDQAIGVLGVGPRSVHQAQLFRQWSADVVFFAGDVDISDEQAEELAARGIDVIHGVVAGLDSVDGALTGVRMADGRVIPRRVVAVGAPVEPRIGFLEPLGLLAEPHPFGMGTHLVTDPAGRTAVPGVWAAGNVTDPAAQVGAAAAAGAWAGAQMNMVLIEAEIHQAVTEHRAGS